jgi:hypothetical protein
MHLDTVEMSPARHAIHSIRNDLTPILCFAEMAKAGDREAQKLLVEELVSRAGSIREELDVLTRVVRRVQGGAIAV